MPSPKLDEQTFKRRFLDQFRDPAFAPLEAELRRIAEAAWDGYSHSRKSPARPPVRGDRAWRCRGAEAARRSLSDWLKSMSLLPAGPRAEVDRYIGYFEPYATSHDALDADLAIQEEVRNAARTLAEAVLAQAAGRLATAGQDLPEPRSK